MDTPIVDFVRGYAQSGISCLHMPGHKGQSLLGFEPLDLTEIRGADELYEPEGIIAQSESNATRLFGTQHTYYSTEGSSQCIRAMLCLALQAAPRTGKRPVLLAARNAHKALLYAAALLDFDIQWLWPAAENAGALCSCPISAQMLTTALQELTGQGSTPLGSTSPARIIWAECRTSGPCRLCATPLGCRCWWTTPTAPTCAFCPESRCTPLHWGQLCAATRPTRPCRWSPAEHICIWGERPGTGGSCSARCTGTVRLHQPVRILQSLDACNRQLTESYPPGCSGAVPGLPLCAGS